MQAGQGTVDYIDPSLLSSSATSSGATVTDQIKPELRYGTRQQYVTPPSTCIPPQELAGDQPANLSLGPYNGIDWNATNTLSSAEFEVLQKDLEFFAQTRKSGQSSTLTLPHEPSAPRAAASSLQANNSSSNAFWYGQHDCFPISGDAQQGENTLPSPASSSNRQGSLVAAEKSKIISSYPSFAPHYAPSLYNSGGAHNEMPPWHPCVNKPPEIRLDPAPYSRPIDLTNTPLNQPSRRASGKRKRPVEPNMTMSNVRYASTEEQPTEGPDVLVAELPLLDRTLQVLTRRNGHVNAARLKAVLSDPLANESQGLDAEASLGLVDGYQEKLRDFRININDVAYMSSFTVEAIVNMLFQRLQDAGSGPNPGSAIRSDGNNLASTTVLPRRKIAEIKIAPPPELLRQYLLKCETGFCGSRNAKAGRFACPRGNLCQGNEVQPCTFASKGSMIRHLNASDPEALWWCPEYPHEFHHRFERIVKRLEEIHKDQLDYCEEKQRYCFKPNTENWTSLRVQYQVYWGRKTRTCPHCHHVLLGTRKDFYQHVDGHEGDLSSGHLPPSSCPPPFAAQRKDDDGHDDNQPGSAGSSAWRPTKRVQLSESTRTNGSYRHESSQSQHQSRQHAQMDVWSVWGSPHVFDILSRGHSSLFVDLPQHSWTIALRNKLWCFIGCNDPMMQSILVMHRDTFDCDPGTLAFEKIGSWHYPDVYKCAISKQTKKPATWSVCPTEVLDDEVETPPQTASGAVERTMQIKSIASTSEGNRSVTLSTSPMGEGFCNKTTRLQPIADFASKARTSRMNSARTGPRSSSELERSRNTHVNEHFEIVSGEIRLVNEGGDGSFHPWGHRCRPEWKKVLDWPFSSQKNAPEMDELLWLTKNCEDMPPPSHVSLSDRSDDSTRKHHDTTPNKKRIIGETHPLSIPSRQFRRFNDVISLEDATSIATSSSGIVESHMELSTATEGVSDTLDTSFSSQSTTEPFSTSDIGKSSEQHQRTDSIQNSSPEFLCPRDLTALKLRVASALVRERHFLLFPALTRFCEYRQSLIDHSHTQRDMAEATFMRKHATGEVTKSQVLYLALDKSYVVCNLSGSEHIDDSRLVLQILYDMGSGKWLTAHNHIDNTHRHGMDVSEDCVSRTSYEYMADNSKGSCRAFHYMHVHRERLSIHSGPLVATNRDFMSKGKDAGFAKRLQSHDEDAGYSHAAFAASLYPHPFSWLSDDSAAWRSRVDISHKLSFQKSVRTEHNGDHSFTAVMCPCLFKGCMYVCSDIVNFVEHISSHLRQLGIQPPKISNCETCLLLRFDDGPTRMTTWARVLQHIWSFHLGSTEQASLVGDPKVDYVFLLYLWETRVKDDVELRLLRSGPFNMMVSS